MINVLIADDQNFVRKTIETYLKPESDLQIVGFAENGREAVQKVTQLKPDVVLMDIEMPVMDGLSATQAISIEHANTKVLMLSIRDREQDVARALELGAKGYWLKNTTAQDLADAIRHVHKGYFQLALELVDKHFAMVTTAEPPVQEEMDLSNKLKMVDTVLAQVDDKLDPFEEPAPHNLNETIESIVKQEMSLKRERDANLQFRLDRLGHKFKRYEQKTNTAILVLTICSVVLFVALIILGYFVIAK